MTLDPGDLAVVVGVVALGPWGLVLVVALMRGYNLSIRLRRPAGRNVIGMNETRKTDKPAADQVEGNVAPAVIPAVVPEVVEPDPPARVDEDKLAEAADRGKVSRDDDNEGTR